MRVGPALAACLASALAAPRLVADTVATDPFVASGIRQVGDGDYEAAAFTLDTAVRRLAGRAGATQQLTRAYVWLGAAYVGLQHEDAATGKFRQALALDPQLRLSPDEFSASVIKAFEVARLKQTATNRKRQAKIALLLGGVAGGAALGISAARSGQLPANRPPVPAIGISPPGQALPAITTLTLTGSASDADGDPVSFDWDFGDGANATGATVTHVFRSEGSYAVTLKASDGRGGTATTRATLTARMLGGTWRADGFAAGPPYQCVHRGSSLDCQATGTYDDYYARTWSGTLSDPRKVALQLAIYNRGRFEPSSSSGTCAGEVTSDLNSIVCFHDNPGGSGAWVFTRQ